MPTVSVDKEDLWERLGQKFCTQCHPCLFRDHPSSRTASEEFDRLCFEFGVELDEDVGALYPEIYALDSFIYLDSDYRRSRGRDQTGPARGASGTCMNKLPGLRSHSIPAIEDRNTSK